MIRSITAVAATATLAACGAAPAPAPPAAPAGALGGSDSGQSRSFHLDAGTYRMVWKADQSGARLGGDALLRRLLGNPPVDGVYDNAQAPIVATLAGPGSDTETLASGEYVLVVAVVDPAPWTLTVTRVSTR